MKTSAFLVTLLFLGCTNLTIAADKEGGPAPLSSKKTKECVAVELWRVSGKAVNKGMPIQDKHTVKIPEGWTVIGGTGGGGHPTIAMCRDL